MPAAPARELERLAQDALDFKTVVDIGIIGGVATVQSSFLAEIHAAGQFADAEEIGAVHQFLLERGFVDQRLERLHGPQVGIQAELLAHREQALFGAHGGLGIIVIFRIAHGAEKHRVGAQTGLVGLLRERVAETVDGARAHIGELVGHFVSEFAGDRVHALDRLVDDFGADAVPGQKGNVQFHYFSWFKSMFSMMFSILTVALMAASVWSESMPRVLNS